MIYYDTETVGLHGMAVLLQYAMDEGEIILYEIWKNPVGRTLQLIESFMNHDEGIVGFNLSFDHFHLNKIYNTFRLMNHDIIPMNNIDEIACIEKEARDGVCLKPKHVLDLMLHARKGPYQSTMDRGDIRIKKVPNLLVNELAKELEKRIQLKDIYFAKKKNKFEPKWKIMNIKYSDDSIDPDFKDIVLKFHPTNALKALAVDAGIVNDKDLLLYGDIEIDFPPNELGYAPFALAIGKPGKWNGAWPEKIIYHIQHWSTNELARRYARDDVTYTRGLYHYFGDPPLDDNDSILSCLVGSVRWKGFSIDQEKIKNLKEKAIKKSKSAPTAPAAVRNYIYSHLSEAERIVLQDSNLKETTKKIVLEEIASFTEECCSDKNCQKCNGTGITFHPAAILAQNVLEARLANYEINFYDKLLLAGRLHADFNIIGALSSRMSGSGGLNTQGIKKNKDVRACFPLHHADNILCGGDFISFEVVLADAKYNDPWLREQLLTEINCPFCEGSGCKECKETGKHLQTIHGVFGTFVYPGYSYTDILLTKATADDKYTRAKSAVFTMLYGGTNYSLKERLGIELEAAEKAYRMFTAKARKIGEERAKIANMFQAMTQVGGIGSRVEWHEPSDYIESMFGFRRYFTLENNICRALYELAEKPPEAWTKLKIKVQRRDREQLIGGAVRSALFAAAFNLQGQNTRAAINHVIQSSGATLTKSLQCKIWELQPVGIHEWVVQPMNVHDEIMVPTHPDYIEKLTEIVHNFINENKTKVPLLDIDWKINMKNWSEK